MHRLIPLWFLTTLHFFSFSQDYPKQSEILCGKWVLSEIRHIPYDYRSDTYTTDSFKVSNVLHDTAIQLIIEENTITFISKSYSAPAGDTIQYYCEIDKQPDYLKLWKFAKKKKRRHPTSYHFDIKGNTSMVLTKRNYDYNPDIPMFWSTSTEYNFIKTLDSVFSKETALITGDWFINLLPDTDIFDKDTLYGQRDSLSILTVIDSNRCHQPYIQTDHFSILQMDAKSNVKRLSKSVEKLIRAEECITSSPYFEDYVYGKSIPNSMLANYILYPNSKIIQFVEGNSVHAYTYRSNGKNITLMKQPISGD